MYEKEKVNGIKCNVSSCVYNRDERDCVAGKIDVTCCGCSEANCCAQTECKTFKAKNC